MLQVKTLLWRSEEALGTCLERQGRRASVHTGHHTARARPKSRAIQNRRQILTQCKRNHFYHLAPRMARTGKREITSTG
jgi:hypothetical protein